MQPRRIVVAVVAVTSAVTVGVASNTSAIEAVTTGPVLPTKAEIATNDNGIWSIVGAAPENVLTQAAPDADPVQTAKDALVGYAEGIGIDNPNAELTARPVRTLDDGGSVVRFEQNVSGIPVFGSGVAVRLNADNATLSVSSTIVPSARTAGIDLTPTIDQAQAIELARTGVDAKDGIDPAQLVASPPEMNVYDADLISGDPNGEVLNGPRLVWSVTLATTDEMLRWRVLVDAVEPSVVLSFSETPHGKSRLVCDFGNSPNSKVCRGEGVPSIPGYGELNRGFLMVGDTYDYFKTKFNRDSFDNRGAQIKFITRYCPSPQRCPYGNAFWSGAVLVFGQGYANADDVIAHEFTHAVTDYEANLMYYAESGAINESMSDVFGEFIDQGKSRYYADSGPDKWIIGEDLGPAGTLRSMKNPPDFDDPDRVLSPNYWLRSEDNYGVHINSGVNNKAAYLLAQGGSFNGQTVAALGNDKTAAIYYEALTSVLTPGSDYLDLYWGLQRACQNLIGQKGITSANCTMVERAVTATEMNKVRARRRTTPKTCTQGARTDVFTDNAESGMGNWVANPGAGQWRVSGRASQSGRFAFYAPNPAGASETGPVFSNWMRTKNRIKIPWTGTSYLWFDHSFSIEDSWDGGVVEYSPDGRQWTDLGTAAEAHGYNGIVLGQSRSPIAGRRAFTGLSQGFEQTRISLDKLRGRRVFVRFRMASDATYGREGWSVDDINIYNCSSISANFSSGFQAITPRRLIDTRNADGLVTARGIRRAGSVLKFNARSLGIYRGGHKPTALNLTLTMVGNSGPGFLTAYPCGKRPTTSVLNATAANTVVVNTATVPISASGEICIYNRSQTHLIVDVAGYQTSTKGSTPPSLYQPLAPRRLIDTRNADGLFKVQGRRPARSVLQVDVSNLGIFAKNTTPRALDLTVSTVDNTAAGHVTAYPCGKRPITTVLNTYKPNQVVSNTATVPVSAGDTICIYTHMSTNLVVDISGYYSSTRGPKLSRYRPLAPRRVLDTRNNDGLYKTRGVRPAGSVLRFNIKNLGIQQSGHTPTAYDLTFAMIGNTAPGYITAYPCGTRPTAATMTAAQANLVIANTATIPIATNGDICIYTSVTTHLTADVTGYHFT